MLIVSLIDSTKTVTDLGLTNGQVIIGSTGSAPVAHTLTGTTDEINVANGRVQSLYLHHNQSQQQAHLLLQILQSVEMCQVQLIHEQLITFSLVQHLRQRATLFDLPLHQR